MATDKDKERLKSMQDALGIDPAKRYPFIDEFYRILVNKYGVVEKNLYNVFATEIPALLAMSSEEEPRTPKEALLRKIQHDEDLEAHVINNYDKCGFPVVHKKDSDLIHFILIPFNKEALSTEADTDTVYILDDNSARILKQNISLLLSKNEKPDLEEEIKQSLLRGKDFKGVLRGVYGDYKTIAVFPWTWEFKLNYEEMMLNLMNICDILSRKSKDRIVIAGLKYNVEQGGEK